MTGLSAAETENLGVGPVASMGHFAALVALFLALTVGGVLFQSRAISQPEVLREHPQVAPLYLSILVLEWGLFYYIWKGGLRRTGTTLRALIGGRWSSIKDLLRDAALALGLWLLWTLLSFGWDSWLGPDHAASIQSFLPRGGLESALWIAVSLSAGFCEELVFRGYAQRQFEALTHSRWIALCLQAALFGISHGYQGAEACAKISIYGALFGLMALWRRSLRPGMMAHAWTDICAGLFRI